MERQMKRTYRLSLMALLLSGCAANDVNQAVESAKGAVSRAMAPLTAGDTESAQSSLRQLGTLTAKAGTPPLQTRTQQGLMQLYAKREVSGRELMDELNAMRAAMKERRTAAAVARFMGSLDFGAANLLNARGSGGVDTKKMLVDAALRVFETLVSQQAQSIGYAALDSYLAFLIDDPSLLANEKISLPSPQGLNATQLQRGATMAALVVATRVTGKVLKKAQADFAQLETEYTQLISRREESAKLLYELLSQKRGSGIEKDFNGPDLAYLYDNVQRMTVQQFANDLGTQNLALRYLQRSNPKAYTDYRAQADGLTGRTRGLLRTTSGVLAFGALLVNFSQSVVAVTRDKQVGEIIGLLPMAAEFIFEAPPIVRYAFEAGSKGAEVAVFSDKRFRLIDADGNAAEFARASDVFAQLQQKGDAQQLMNEALFRDGSPGLIYRLFQCDRLEAGRMMDTAVPAGEREKFATAYLQNEDSRFSFANVFEAPRKDNVREAELGDELLRRDHRRTTDDRTRGLSLIQASATQGYSKWGDEQLMRLIFANREGLAAHATLQLGDVRLRPVPSMQSVYVYESLVDGGCRENVGASRVVPGQGAKPAASRSTAPRPTAAPKSANPSPAQAPVPKAVAPAPAPKAATPAPKAAAPSAAPKPTPKPGS